MTCYISLLLYRLLEKKLGNLYTADQILETLRSMQMTLLNTASGYVPSYTRTELTDALHKIFDFRTDHEFITKQICEPSSRIQNRQNQSKDNIVHIAAKRKTVTTPIFTGFVAVLSSYNCQRWDYSTTLFFCKEHLRVVEMSLLFQYNRVKFAYKRKEMNRDDRNKKSHKKIRQFYCCGFS